jgi:acyl dehydratase
VSSPAAVPEPTYDALGVGRRFADYELPVAPDLVRAYARAVDNPALAQQADAPVGTSLGDPSLLVIFGITRRVLARAGRVPAGGILARQDYEFCRPLRLGERIRTRSSIADKYEKRGRRYVHLRCEMIDDDGNRVGQVDSHIIWAR